MNKGKIIILIKIIFLIGLTFYFISSPEDIVDYQYDSLINDVDIVENIYENEKIDGKEVLNIDNFNEEKEQDFIEDRWEWLSRQNKIYSLNSVQVNLTINEVNSRFLDPFEKMKAISILRLGTPYQLGCLGEGSGRDSDPIFRIDVTDCTAFILTNVALFHSRDLSSAREMMSFLNYRSASNISFSNRLHFTTDRNMTSSFFKDITNVIGGNLTKEKKVILNKINSSGSRLIDIDWEKEVLIKYVEKSNINENLFSKAPQVVGIAFIREGDDKIGLDVRHEGILFDGKDFFHASSSRGRVVSENFFEYYSKSNFDGILIFSMIN